jgi:hypothetical protein
MGIVVRLNKEGKEAFLALVKDELTADCLTGRLLPNIQTMGYPIIEKHIRISEITRGNHVVCEVKAYAPVWDYCFLWDLL